MRVAGILVELGEMKAFKVMIRDSRYYYTHYHGNEPNSPLNGSRILITINLITLSVLASIATPTLLAYTCPVWNGALAYYSTLRCDHRNQR